MKIENLSKILSILFPISCIIGGIIVLRYCVAINYFPEGISIADTILFVGCSIIFSFCYFIFWYFIVAPVLLIYKIISWLFSKYKLKRYSLYQLEVPLVPSFLITLFSILLLLVAYSTNNDFNKSLVDQYLHSLLIVLVCLLTLGIKKENEKSFWEMKNEWHKKEISKIILNYGLIIFIIFAPLLYTGIFRSLTFISFKLIGIRKENVVIHLKDEDLIKIFKKKQIKANILWHGIGKNLVIEYNKKRFIIDRTQTSLVEY